MPHSLVERIHFWVGALRAVEIGRVCVPRYFFHTNEPASQRHSVEFKDLHTAKCEAVRFAGQLLCDAAEHFWDDADFELTVTDEKDLILFTMRVFGTEAPAIRSHSR